MRYFDKLIFGSKLFCYLIKGRRHPKIGFLIFQQFLSTILWNSTNFVTMVEKFHIYQYRQSRHKEFDIAAPKINSFLLQCFGKTCAQPK